MSRSAPSSWRGCSSGLHGSRSAIPCPASFSRFARGMLLAIGVLYAVNFATAASLRTRALTSGPHLSSFFELTQAAAIFPLNREARQTEALLWASADWAPPEMALAALHRALASDPYSPRLGFWIVYQLARAGRWDEAWAWFYVVEARAPVWPQTDYLRQLLQENSPNDVP